MNVTYQFEWPPNECPPTCVPLPHPMNWVLLTFTYEWPPPLTPWTRPLLSPYHPWKFGSDHRNNEQCTSNCTRSIVIVLHMNLFMYELIMIIIIINGHRHRSSLHTVVSSNCCTYELRRLSHDSYSWSRYTKLSFFRIKQEVHRSVLKYYSTRCRFEIEVNNYFFTYNSRFFSVSVIT